jgi:hypothetical protein
VAAPRGGLHVQEQSAWAAGVCSFWTDFWAQAYVSGRLPQASPPFIDLRGRYSLRSRLSNGPQDHSPRLPASVRSQLLTFLDVSMLRPAVVSLKESCRWFEKS